MLLHIRVSFILLLFLLCSCDKILDIKPPINSITGSKVFSSDQFAISAVLGIYSTASFINPAILSGSSTVMGGLCSDELVYTQSQGDYAQFFSNSVQSNNGTLTGVVWQRAYQLIYQTNICIEGLNQSKSISNEIRSQLIGECLVLRSLIYFNLVNLFGPVPLITSTDYNNNSVLGRTSEAEIYFQIEGDLIKAQNMLSTNYPSEGKVRINKYAATTLLARLYLYEQKWAQAEVEASKVINSNSYSLTESPGDAFFANSVESIFQILPVFSGFNTAEGNTFVPPSYSTSIPNFLVSPSLINEIEIGDLRKSAWINNFIVNGTFYSYPAKYKKPADYSSSFSVTEYYTVFRLAELYLIRAESEAQQGELDAAVDDINIIRSRSRDTSLVGALPNISRQISKPQLLSAIQHERRIELMVEWGNRWFDLKRWQETDAVLGGKSGWKSSDTLLPIPDAERLLNPALTQNIGYN